ncbi:transcriptional regulator GcvA, partial [Burkholderia sp. Ac-20353]|uniref:transcriptional regulator GcvA n=1 Tax=Burkholderia sp. Ac-20353 TaxID=2703894 RepID=UPI00197B4082
MARSPRYPTLPSLLALRYFESVGRHLSIKRAADEVHVTPAAVSQQIVKLEQELGLDLLTRTPHGIALTPHGTRYFDDLQGLFAQIVDATDRLRRHASQTDIVTVSCAHSFAMQWLVPRLPELAQAAPAVDLRISTTNRHASFADEHVDFAVRHGEGRYPGVMSERLLDDPLYPVCSPRIVDAHGPFLTPADLRRATLLHDERRDDWRAWLGAHAVTGVRGDRGPVFVDSNGTIQAAIAAHGVALARKSIVSRELDDGRLVVLFDAPLATDYAYYLVYPERVLGSQRARAFRDWLLEAARPPAP